MSVTLDTSHSPIGPCGPLEQPPFGNSFRHVSIALTSCNLDSGENGDVGAKTGMGTEELHMVRDIDPNDPSNISSLLAFE